MTVELTSREDASGIILKTPEEIDGIRKSCRLAYACLDHVAPFVQPGATTADLNRIAAEFISSSGAVPATLGYKGYPAETCVSVNEVICHGIPDARVLKEGDIVKIDVATILNGFYGDTCRTFPVGKISRKALELVDCARRCLAIGVRQVKPGNYIGDIGFHIANHAHAHGYSVVHHFCGHGVGLRFHEGPQVDHNASRMSGPMMKPGMIFTVEPMINEGRPVAEIDERDNWTARTRDGKLSAQFEHTVLVTEDGYEVLTRGERPVLSEGREVKNPAFYLYHGWEGDGFEIVKRPE